VRETVLIGKKIRAQRRRGRGEKQTSIDVFEGLKGCSFIFHVLMHFK
jgi:hypothetical protein